MTRLLTAVGQWAVRLASDAGETALLFGSTIAGLVSGPYYVRSWFAQMFEIGNRSLPVVLVTAGFSGAVFALQTWEGFAKFGATGLVGFAVARGMTRELVPVMASLMVAGRAGSAMAAEIGTMMVTEQVDALKTMAVDPVRYLVVPRVLAAALMLPILVVIGDLMGIFGGYAVAVRMLGAAPTAYWNSSFDFLDIQDVAGGLLKASLFGIMIALFSCARGFRTSGGAQGVGRATTGAMVTSSMAILVSDFFLTKLLLSLWNL